MIHANWIFKNLHIPKLEELHIGHFDMKKEMKHLKDIMKNEYTVVKDAAKSWGHKLSGMRFLGGWRSNKNKKQLLDHQKSTNTNIGAIQEHTPVHQQPHLTTQSENNENLTQNTVNQPQGEKNNYHGLMTNMFTPKNLMDFFLSVNKQVHFFGNKDHCYDHLVETMIAIKDLLQIERNVFAAESSFKYALTHMQDIY